MIDFEYIRSVSAHGVHVHGGWNAFVGIDREIWLGSDGSGAIRESGGPVEFFTEEGRARWEAAGAPELAHGPSLHLFAPACLGGSRARRARLSNEAGALRRELDRHSEFRLSDVTVGQTSDAADALHRVHGKRSPLAVD